MPAHVMENVGWDPSCTTVDPAIDLSGGPFKIGSVSAQSIKLVQNPKWWGTPANARSITVHIASSTQQLTRWMATGFVQVAEPTTVTHQFLTEMTGLPGAQSDVDTSATLLQLDMASSLDSPLSPDLRVAIALSINRQDLVNQQAAWAVPGLVVADSHVSVQGQQNYKGATPTTTTVPTPTSSTSTTVIGAGGSVNFPVTPVPDQADALLTASGLVRTPGFPYYHSAFGAPFQLHIAYDESDPWAAAAAPVIQEQLKAAGLDTTLYGVDGAAKTGQVLSTGFVDLALLPVTFTPYMSQTLSWYTMLLGPAGKNGSQDWTGYSNGQFNHLVETASQQLNPNTAQGYYTQADTKLWDDMVSLPLYAEPAAIAWSRRIGGMTPTPRSDSLLWFAQLWAVRQPESTSNTTPSLPGQ
jgi:peptide/nickel transport system substrate-binding protein